MDDFIPFVLYNAIIEKSKSVFILLKNKQHAGVDVLTRTIFEQSVLLEFIINKVSYNRAKAFHLSNNLRSVEYAEELSKPENLQLLGNFFGGRERFEFIESYLNEEYQELKKEFELVIGAKQSKYWFKIVKEKDVKIDNFKELCKYLSEEKYVEYIALYASLSQEAHGKDITKYYSVTEDSLNLTYKKESSLPMAYVKK